MGNEKNGKEKSQATPSGNFDPDSTTKTQAPPATNFETNPIQGFFPGFGDVVNKLGDTFSDFGESLGNTFKGAYESITGEVDLVGKKTVVTDPNAWLRDPANKYQYTGVDIPEGTEVEIQEVSKKGSKNPRYVKVVGTDGTEYGWTKYNNLEPVYKPSKSEKGGSGAGSGGSSASDVEIPRGTEVKLPENEEQWTQTVLDSRKEVSLDTNWSFDARLINPSLLTAIRYDEVGGDEFYKHIYLKRGKARADTPMQMAKELGNMKIAQQEVLQQAPRQKAEKMALIDAKVKDGGIDIKKGTAGNLRVQLHKGFDKAVQDEIKAWFKSKYGKGRLVLDAAGVQELKNLISDKIQQQIDQAQNNPKIQELEDRLDAKEAELKTLFAEKAASTTHAKKKALWQKLSSIINSEGLYVTRTMGEYVATMGDGTTVKMDTEFLNSKNFLNPGGYKVGGSSRYTEKDMKAVFEGKYGEKGTHKRDTAEKFMKTLNKNEGAADSMNTWDGEIVTAGPGLSGGGRLQKAMARYKAYDPAGFHETMGRFGIDIVQPSKGNAYFTLRVPNDETMIPAQMKGKVSPGQFIKGSQTTGASKSGGKYQECQVLRYISFDKILLSRIMYAGKTASFRECLVQEATKSLDKAFGASFSVPAEDGTDMPISWTEVAGPLGGQWLSASQAVLAYRYHASSKKFSGAVKKIRQYYIDNFGKKKPEDLSDSQRKDICKFVAQQIKSGKYSAYRAQFPDVADEMFPVKKKGK